MGIRAVILTNAAGGINLSYSQGALVVISDHINLQGTNPLVGPNDDRFGVRFPDMTQAYARAYRRDRPRRSRQAQHSRSMKACTPLCLARAMKLPRRSNICAASVPTS